MRRFAKLVLVLVSLVLIAEGALRLIGLGDPVLLQPDGRCGYVLRPNQAHFRFLAHTRINAESMRSEPIAAQKPPGSYRLMFVGDSIAYGTTMVDQDAIFVEVLHRDLPAILHRPVEVLNASASAWAIDNELAYIESRGIFQSDRVILVLNDGDLDQRMSTVNDVGNALYFEKPSCALCELIHHYASRTRVDKGSVVESDAGQREKNLKSLTVFRDYVYAHNSGMIILFVPFRRDVKSPSSRVIQTELTSWARQNEVPVIDATPLLAQLSVKEASVDGGTHLSVKGNQPVAKSFEQSLANPTLLQTRTGSL
jgi:hypothetical protein